MGEFEMSDRKDKETRENNTSKNIDDISEECLELMRFNYENLDRAVWKAHHFSWFMTSLFIPSIFAGLGYMLKELDDIGVFSVVAGSIVVMGITWFWYAFTRILAGYNSRRFKQLIKLEEMFDRYYPTGFMRKDKQFVQYRKLPGQQHKLRFRYVALSFAIFLSVLSGGAAIVKMALWACMKMGVI